MKIPNFGIEIDIIDNRKHDGYCGPDLSKLTDGFMTDSIDSMIEFLEDTAKELKKAKEQN